ncbi:MAG TPA: DeoR/GlpR family DNA-binding transcription regulator [Terracidiphilus sp.]|nr:DeoR/GlpR family DNA-binding transcription regulator [Terracidiphilus sp.]
MRQFMYCVSRMPGRFENVSARQDLILHRLQETGEVSVEELCASLEASTATIRRDLDELEQRSLLRRTRGGAISISSLFYEPFKHDLSFQDKVETFAAEKRRIAQAAAELVEPGATVALSGGTTTTEVVRYLKLLRGITIITNAVNLAMELSSHKEIDVVVTGGHLRGNWFTLVGPLANQAAAMLFSDIMFIGVDGIDAEQGLTCVHPQEAEFLRILTGHTRRRVVVADHSKLGTVSRWLLCPAGEVQMIITDRDAGDEMIDPFQKMGVEVKRV